jgi:hypothetical protein
MVFAKRFWIPESGRPRWKVKGAKRKGFFCFGGAGGLSDLPSKH